MTSKNTVYLTTAFLLGGTLTAIAMNFMAQDTAPPAANLMTAQFSALESRLDKLDVKISNLRMETPVLTGNGVKVAAASPAPREDVNTIKSESTVLTDGQQAAFERLSQNIELSSNGGGFTMDQLTKGMRDLPKEQQNKLLHQVGAKVARGELDPQLFVEGRK